MDVVQKLEDQYPHGVRLVYIDYRDYVEDGDALEKLAQTGHPFADDFSPDWFLESEVESAECIMREVFPDDVLTEEELEEVERWIYDNDTSNPIKELVQNTPKRFYFYDLGVELSYFVDANQKGARKIAQAIGTKYEDAPKFFDGLISNSYASGSVGVLFTASPIDFFGEIEETTITFRGTFDICVVDRFQGSGYADNSPFPELSFQFKRENLHDEDAMPGYSYSRDIAGLCLFEEAKIKFSNKRAKKIQVN